MPRLSTGSIINLCHSLRHQLGAGVAIADVFRRLARKPSSPSQAIAAPISAALEAGSDFAAALAAAQIDWPPLFTALVAVGEQTGMLPEVFGILEEFYLRQQKLRRAFLAQITWPVMQLSAAIGVLTLLIWAMGTIVPASRPGVPAYDPLGLGLSGTVGALIFLASVGAVLGLVVGGYFLLTRWLRAGAAVDRLLLRVPALGPCLRTLAIARFCLALRLTTQTGMPLRSALRLSFAATGNAAFVERGDLADKGVRGGKELTLALARTGLFPEEFRAVLHVGEESGRLDEVLRQQAAHYDEEASRRLTALATVVGYGIWVGIGIVLIVVILRMFSSYTALLTNAGALLANAGILNFTHSVPIEPWAVGDEAIRGTRPFNARTLRVRPEVWIRLRWTFPSSNSHLNVFRIHQPEQEKSLASVVRLRSPSVVLEE